MKLTRKYSSNPFEAAMQMQAEERERQRIERRYLAVFGGLLIACLLLPCALFVMDMILSVLSGLPAPPQV